MVKNKNDDYAGFWLRFISYIIDSAIIALFSSGLSMLLFLMVFPDDLAAVVSIAVVWLYYAFMESSSYQGTVGKMAVGLKVTDMKGKPITFGRATGRFFGKILSMAILFIGFLMIGFTKQKQGLHDMLADCLVLKKD